MSTATAKRTMTAEAFFRKYDGTPWVELVDGQLVRLPMTGPTHGNLGANITVLLREYARKRKSGHVLVGDVGILVKRAPDTVRAADVLFLSFAKWPKDKIFPRGPLTVVPELVVEVLSPSDRPKAVRLKIADYLAAGVKAVMYVDPAMESVAIYRDDEWPQQFHNGDKVTVPDVLPGFSAPVKAFFA